MGLYRNESRGRQEEGICGAAVLTVVSGVHGRVVLQVAVLVVWDGGGVGGCPAPRPAGGTVCKDKPSRVPDSPSGLPAAPPLLLGAWTPG